MTSVCVKAIESDYLVNGHYTCFIRGIDIVITDGEYEWIISRQNIDEIEDEIEALETALEGKSDVGHVHSISDVTDLQDALDNKSDVGHGHVISDVSNLQLVLDGKASVSHEHSLEQVIYTYEEEESYQEEEMNDEEEMVVVEKTRMITKHKGLDELIAEHETQIQALINGTANRIHTHNATQVKYTDDKNVKQELDDINGKIEVLDGNGDKQGILDIIFGGIDIAEALGEGALFSQIQTLQGQIAALDASLAAHIGTYAVSNTTNEIMEVADEISDFSEVASESRTWVDGLSNWLSRCRSWLTSRTNGYTQITNNYTAPALQSVGNESMLFDIDAGLLNI